MDSCDRIARRTGVSTEDVLAFAAEFDSPTVMSVISYLEKRIETMRGDENPKYELEQIRRDLGALATNAITNKTGR